MGLVKLYKKEEKDCSTWAYRLECVFNILLNRTRQNVLRAAAGQTAGRHEIY